MNCWTCWDEMFSFFLFYDIGKLVRTLASVLYWPFSLSLWFHRERRYVSILSSKTEDIRCDTTSYDNPASLEYLVIPSNLFNNSQLC